MIRILRIAFSIDSIKGRVGSASANPARIYAGCESLSASLPSSGAVNLLKARREHEKEFVLRFDMRSFPANKNIVI
jgi:hypothetical protein